MNKLTKILLLLLPFLFSTFSYAASRPNKSLFKSVKGDASHFYRYDSDEEKLKNKHVLELVKELHEDYDLLIVKYRNYFQSFVFDGNKDSRRLRKNVHSNVIAYSPLFFRKQNDGSYLLIYSEYLKDNVIQITLSEKYNEKVTKLFTDLKAKADHVKIKGSSSYARGGYSVEMIDLPDLDSISLNCKNEVYYDGSGGDSCTTISKNIEFSGSDAKASVDGTYIPLEKLKNWQNNN